MVAKRKKGYGAFAPAPGKHRKIPWPPDNNQETAIGDARAQGLIIVVSDPNTLLLDLDKFTAARRALFERRYTALSQRGFLRGAALLTASSTPGNAHGICWLSAPQTDVCLRVGLELWLGSDRWRALWGLRNAPRWGDKASLLFDSADAVYIPLAAWGKPQNGRAVPGALPVTLLAK